MTNAVIAGFVRTPFQFARKGGFAQTRPDDLAAAALKALVERTGVDPERLDDVILGCAFPEGEQGNNIARIAIFLAGLPVSLPGMTVNRFCGSSMSAIHIAVGQIAAGAGEAFLCGGAESMSLIPARGGAFRPNPRFRSADMPDAELMTEAYVPMGETAENVAAKYGVDRQAQERFAVASQKKAGEAQASGRLKDEIVPVQTADELVDQDGCIRPQTTLEGLAGLKPAFRPDGTVTAGLASPLTDGASAVLVCSEAFARRNGLEVLARVRSMSAAGCPPELMGMGPVPATAIALERAGLTAGDIDLVEFNEAFASQAVACLRELDIPEERVNLDGGALALGHPLGATGARLVGKAAMLLKREAKRYALATQCVGGGQGVATVLEAV